MAHSLYRKYRPQTFADVIGQNHIKVTLQNELTTGRVSHAYLFTGPRGVGKTTVARLLAKAVNCQHPAENGDPDDTCAACVEIREGRSLDVIEIDAASNTGVDNVRSQIIENARFSPSRWKYKVFVIDEVHMLSVSAFNALLKTLEEPPAHALFVLATTELHKVPETIVSRCQRFDFRPLTVDDLSDRLRTILQRENVQVDDAVIGMIARAARGSSRDAESLLGQVLSLADGAAVTEEQAALVVPRSNYARLNELLDALIRKDATAGLVLINTLVADGVQPSQFLQDMVEFLRKALLLKISTQLALFSTLELPPNEEQELLSRIESVSADELTRMLKVFAAIDVRAQAALPQLPLEMAIVELTLTADSPTATMSVPPPPPITPRPVTPAPPKKIEQTPTSVSASPNADFVAQEMTPVAAPIAASPSFDGATVALADVQQRWSEILRLLQTRNQSLRLTMNVAVPQALETDTLVLGVGYDFHRERLEMPKHRSEIESVLAELFGQPLRIRPVLAENMQQIAPSFEKEANIEVVNVPLSAAASPVAALPSRSAEATPLTDVAWEALIEAFGAGGKASSAS